MTNEELITGLRHIAHTMERNGHSYYQHIAEDAIQALEQIRWIPVNERLPEKNMECLVCVGKLNFTQIAVYSDLMKTIDHKIFYQGDYGKDNFENITQYVKAWMPLPEPYKEGEADDE